MAKKRTTRKTTRKTTARRPAAKKKTTRKKATRTTTTRRKTSRVTAADKPRTKSQIFTEIAGMTELTRKDVAAVFEAMSTLMAKDLSSRGPGTFTVPGLMKVVKQHKPRRPAQKNVLNPFTGEYGDRAAKPAHNVVKVRPLKTLKEMV